VKTPKFRDELVAHLTQYCQSDLQVTAGGKYRGRTYGHVLPYALADLNLLPTYRPQIVDFLKANRQIKRHQFFHHLNSSQAFAFNLFVPYFSTEEGARDLALALGETAPITGLALEAVPDAGEGTNVDALWRHGGGGMTYCEVKLTEEGFGTAKADERHLGKLAEIYERRLRGKVDDGLLEPKSFFKHYQIMRNISLLDASDDARLLFLFPRANIKLTLELDRVMPHVRDDVRQRISVRHVEDVLSVLQTTGAYRAYADELARKYVPVALPAAS
jgi:hypothetical protein